MTDDFYDLLGVDRDATQEEIRKAFRGQVRKYHPDLNDDPRAPAQFTALKKAYDTLGDPEERKAYERMGHESYVSKRISGLPSPDQWRIPTGDGERSPGDGGGSPGSGGGSPGSGGGSPGDDGGSLDDGGDGTADGSYGAAGGGRDRASTGAREAESGSAASASTGAASSDRPGGASGRNGANADRDAAGSARRSRGSGGSSRSTGGGNGGSTAPGASASSTGRSSARASRKGTADPGTTASATGGSTAAGGAGSSVASPTSRSTDLRRDGLERLRRRFDRIERANLGWPLIALADGLYLAGLTLFAIANFPGLERLSERIAAEGWTVGGVWAALGSRAGIQDLPTFVENDVTGGTVFGGVLVIAGMAALPSVYFLIIRETRATRTPWRPSYLFGVAAMAPAVGLIVDLSVAVEGLYLDAFAYVLLPVAAIVGLPASAFVRPRVKRFLRKHWRRLTDG